MKKIKLLFKIGYVYHKAGFDPVIEKLLTNPGYDVWFSLDMEKKRHLFIDRPFIAPVIREWEKQGYRFTTETRGFDIVITGDTLRNSEKYGKTLLCFLNHGTGIKNILYRNLARVPNDKYQIFIEGEHRHNSLKSAGSLQKNEAHVVGLPKLDWYFQGKYQRQEVLTGLGLDPEKKTLLFAPTYKPTCLYQIKDDIFEQTRDEFNLIVKLHPYSWMGKYAPHKQHRIYEKRVRKFSHARLLPFSDYNIVPYYAAADVILSEASSCVFDFLALKKTGIVFDLEPAKHSDGQSLLEIENRDFLKDAFIHIESGKDINQAMKLALEPTPGMLAAQDNFRKNYFYKLDGKASERFIAKIEELYNESGHENIPEV
ncbi:MAG: CDP-glycerol glycerophosphotransferase family protein [Candidatus Cloacimonetes bacterium]|nr:CDP-glycerol glycerophosphotransferase family protein [Candidatus Cloacimonadota bacterium]